MNVHIKSIVSAIIFSLLFYSKSLGLNLFIISILVIVLVSSFKKQSNIFWGYSLTYTVTAILVFINPSIFSIFVHVMAFMVFVGKSISNKASLYLSWLIGLSNLIVASIANYTKKQNTVTETETKREISPQLLNRLKGLLFAFILLVLFGMLYKNANPVFEKLIDDISFKFISIPWLLFTCLGYYIFLNLLRPLDASEVVAFDLAQKNELETPTEITIIGEKNKLESEHTLGTIVFISLNLLLAFFLVTDVIYLFDKTDISNAEYSNSVHRGVYALMFSIVLAILLILYFFRGNLNFYKKNQKIKSFTYAWIALNIILVISTAYKNFTYIEALGLTYKRIGVYVYLILTLTGLITAFIKVAQVKSFIYLVRMNTAAVFTFLVISAAVPWDKTITWFNLTTLETPDFNYLIRLGESNSVQLQHYANTRNLDVSLKNRIHEKYSDYIALMDEKTWQEYTLVQFVKNDKQ